jgi:outer membrane receptor protein involved in Fe transport
MRSTLFTSIAVFALGLLPATALAQPDPVPTTPRDNETPPAAPPASAAPPPASPAPAAPPAAPPAPKAAAPAAAGDDSDADLSAMLNEQVVSGASRVTESIETAPVTASTIRAEDMRKYGIRTLGEALRFLSNGVFTQDGSNAVNSTSGARGVGLNGDTNRHFLFIIDGSVASSNVGTVTGWAFGLPLEMIDTIEVILGPGSVLYGGNAMLGVINIKTKTARHMSGVRVYAEYGVSPSADGSGHFSSFGPSGDGTSPRISASVGHAFSFLDQDAEVTGQFEWAQRTAANAPIANQTQSPATVNGVAVQPFGGTWSNQVVDSNTGGYARVKWGRLVLDAQINAGVQPAVGSSAGQTLPDSGIGSTSLWTVQTKRFDATYSFDAGPRVSGFIRPYALASNYDNTREVEIGSTNCPPGGTPNSRCVVTNSFVANHQGMELQGTWDVSGDGIWQLLAGVDGRAQQQGNVSRAQDAASSQFFAPTGSFDATGETVGGYGQLRGQPWKWLGLNAGVRGDWYHADATGIVSAPTSNPVTTTTLPSMDGSAVSPRGGIVISPTETTTIHSSIGRAFRPPSAIERYTTTAVVELAGDLKPETVTSFEVGIKQKLGAHRALLTGFVSEWDDMIGLGQGSALGKVKYQDTGNIQNYGLNTGVEGSFLLQQLQYAASFTWGYARQTTPAPNLSGLPTALAATAQKEAQYAVNNIQLQGAPEVYGNARVSYDFGGSLPVAALATSVYGPTLTSFAYTNVLGIAPGSNIPVFGYNWRSNINPKFTDPMIELRLTLTGPIPKMPAVHYRLMGSYLFSSALSPNAFGPQPGGAVPTVANVPGLAYVPEATGQLFPTSVATVMAGLDFTLDP